MGSQSCLKSRGQKDRDLSTPVLLGQQAKSEKDVRKEIWAWNDRVWEHVRGPPIAGSQQGISRGFGNESVQGTPGKRFGGIPFPKKQQDSCHVMGTLVPPQVEGADCYDLGTWYPDAEKTPDLTLSCIRLVFLPLFARFSVTHLLFFLCTLLLFGFSSLLWLWLFSLCCSFHHSLS